MNVICIEGATRQPASKSKRVMLETSAGTFWLTERSDGTVVLSADDRLVILPVAANMIEIEVKQP